ncbi:Transcriptional corepressor SEUSS-like protein [Drosera capensis]
MVASGAPTPIGGAQTVTPSLLRSNSGLLGGQGGQMPSQGVFPSLVSPRTQYNNINLLGNIPNVSSLLNQSFGNGPSTSGLSGSSSGQQRRVLENGAESDPLSAVGNGMGFGSSSFMGNNMGSSGSAGQGQGQQFSNSNKMLVDQQQLQQIECQNYQYAQQSLQQISASPNSHSQEHQQYQSLRGSLGGDAPVKLEPQISADQHGQQQQQQQQHQQQQWQSLRSLSQVKLEPQQLQSLRSLSQVKVEQQHSDQSLYLQQQQHQHQQQHLLQMSIARQSSQAAAEAQMNLLQQQRLMQIQQQQQLLKTLPQQRSQLQQQYRAQNLAIRCLAKPNYEPGMFARRLTHYMYQQQHRPEDNNIDFWRKFVAEFFAPNAKKKWCVSLYGSSRQTTGVFPQDAWHCDICNCKPGRGFEATVEVLPRLYKIKYESGTLEELLYIDMPKEYQNSSGQIVLDYGKAIQEIVFEQLRVVREGQLRVVFSTELKICSWEFCAQRHEELIPRKLLIPQVSQLGAAAQKYQAATQNASSNISVSDMQSNCNMFVASARQLMKALDVPLVNDLGYTKRYVRCLQISEVVNSMKDLIDYSRLTGTGPMESLAKFPRRTSSLSGAQGLNQETDEAQQQFALQVQVQPSHQQHAMPQNLNQNSVHAAAIHASSSNGIATVNNSLGTSASPSGAIPGLLHQNSINSRSQNPMTNANRPYGGSLMLRAGSSGSMQQAQLNPSQFHSPTPSSSNNLQQQTSHGAMATTNHISAANSPANLSTQQPALSGDGDTNDSQSSVQKIIQEMMMSGQHNSAGSMMGNDVKAGNGILPIGSNFGVNGTDILVANGPSNSNLSMSGSGYGGMGSGIGTVMNGIRESTVMNEIRAAKGNNAVNINGRVGISSMARDQSSSHQQQEMGNQILNGLGAVNGFSNYQFDWKPSS